MAAKIYTEKHEGTVIEYTPDSGPYQGKTLRRGRPSVDGAVVWFPAHPFTEGKKVGAKVEGKPDLKAAADEYRDYFAREAAESERKRREAQAAADEFEKTDAGKRLRAAIDHANAIEEASKPIPETPPTPHTHVGPTDSDIRSLEGNEDIEDPYTPTGITTRAERAEARGWGE
jgi:hypothetical protein